MPAARELFPSSLEPFSDALTIIDANAAECVPSSSTNLCDDEAAEVAKLEALAESLLLQVAERDVELDDLRLQHKHGSAGDARVVRANEAWLGAPRWMHAGVYVAIFIGLILMR